MARCRGPSCSSPTAEKTIFHRAYGNRQVEPTVEPMTADTVFDLASLTKPLATATSVLMLVDAGKVELDAPVVKYLPEFAPNGKDQITVRDLLTHQGGLLPDNSLKDYLDGPELAWERICALDLRAEPRTQFIYTDVGFITLGKLVERVSGEPLNDFARKRIYLPLGMRETMYRPGEELDGRAAPTEKNGETFFKGTVHDPRAAALGGVAGHAGLFSTADDLARYAAMVHRGGRGPGGETILSSKIIRQMASPQQTPRGTRGLGWDKQSPYSSNRGDLLSDSAIGHGGFTGTAMWIDPEQQLTVIFLSNRLHPDGKGTVNRLAGRVATIAAAALPE